ncbi:MAG: DUF2202 domain-containing protein [Vicinamibacterales bacterium]
MLSLSVAAVSCGGSSVAPSGTSVAAPAVDGLGTAIADEYRAEAIYQGVIADFGQVVPFVNVLTAEQRHSAAIAAVMRAYGLAVPADPWTTSTVPHFPTFAAACSAGVTAEQDNIALYDRLLVLDLPAEARRVFESNRLASLQNHLPAFARCAQ